MSTSVFQRVGTRLALPLIAGFLVCAPAWSVATSENAQPTGESAVWKDKELTFVYMGFTTKYSCDGLSDKVKRALIQLGANRKSLKVTPSGCSYGFGRPEPFPGVRVKMQVLEPAANIAPDDKQPQVQARWQPVDLKLTELGRNENGECELLEQIRDKILPLFATRNVALQASCVPHQGAPGGAVLKADVLRLDQKTSPQSHRATQTN